MEIKQHLLHLFIEIREIHHAFVHVIANLSNNELYIMHGSFVEPDMDMTSRGQSKGSFFIGCDPSRWEYSLKVCGHGHTQLSSSSGGFHGCFSSSSIHIPSGVQTIILLIYIIC